MSESGKKGKRAFAIEDWADYIRFQEKKYGSGVKFEDDPEEEILDTKGIEEVSEVYVISYGGSGEKQIIEEGVFFIDWNRAKAWGDKHAEGRDWRVESLSPIDRDLRL